LLLRSRTSEDSILINGLPCRGQAELRRFRAPLQVMLRSERLLAFHSYYHLPMLTLRIEHYRDLRSVNMDLFIQQHG